ncbi:phage terminase small subunit P27 family [Silicimonas algicola]|uniref:P27 family predicted phage terminase small subunit n=1 Tax=Silicimonas algicola TaxID=1826607 RepID=A0A316FSC6_9RHOB|nr:phage terminase small subunit P27 family [Silicimonas algicola]AZQ67636.1 phage terminase small subunit P27 family [Silicimonas algicola]PWK51671.1 P27 family predicted phage terminase small subunit [Silicimonas algicola]
MRGPKPRPARPAGKDDTHAVTPDALPRCPAHLGPVARKEWRRLAAPLHKLGILTVADRAAFAAYCQAWERWVEAEEQLQKTPMLLKTPSGYVQQSPWLSIANKQMELMARYMAELGLTPSARRRVMPEGIEANEPLIIFKTVYEWEGKEIDAAPDSRRPMIRLPPGAENA